MVFFMPKDLACCLRIKPLATLRFYLMEAHFDLKQRLPAPVLGCAEGNSFGVVVAEGEVVVLFDAAALLNCSLFVVPV